MTPEEKHEVQHLLDAHERTIAICRACANTAHDLAWQITRGSLPEADELARTIAEAERVLDDLGTMEIAIGRLKAAL